MAVALGYYASVPSNSATAPNPRSNTMNIAQSAASFVGTKSAAPKSRKPSAHNQKVMAKQALENAVGKDLVAVAEMVTANPSLVSQLTAQIVEAPKAEAKPKASKAPNMVVLTIKGAKFTPIPKRSKVKGEANAATWATIKALFHDADEVSLADIRKAIPTHTDFVGYALRSGWLAAA